MHRQCLLDRPRQLRHQVMLVMQLVRGALSDLRDVSDTLLVLEIEGSLRRPTGQGYATIGRLLQASIDTTLATCAAASAFLADPTLARYEAVIASLDGDLMRGRLFAACLESEEAVSAAIESLGWYTRRSTVRWE